MKTIICFFLFWIPVMCIAQLNPGAKQIALSNSDVAMSDDVFSVFNNIAGLDRLKKRQIGVYYSPSPFGLTELANGFICINQSFSFGSIGFGLMNYGFDLYKEHKYTLGYSKEIYSGYFVGGALDYQTVSIKNYGTASALLINTGFLCTPVKDISWGFYITNLTRSSLGKSKDQIPVIFNSGICYNPKENIFINAAVEKDVDYPASLKFGIDYTIIKIISVRAGFASEPEVFSAGLGINYLFLNCDYAIVNHPDLGISHQFGIIISMDQ